jgi:glycosyltransferase involved in cell wall biosynthesis
MNGISVITTLFNYKHYIGDCIRSVINQVDPEVPVEHIIVDDCSKDNPKKILDKYASDQLRCFFLSKNMGYSAAKNYGIRKSRYDTLVMLDADDWLTENSLHIRYKRMEKKEADMIHGPVHLISRQGNRIGLSPLFKGWNKNKNSDKRWKYIHAQGVMLKKKIHSEIGLYDESMKCKSDREMWARIFNRGYRIGTVAKPVAWYRIHPDQMHKSKWKRRNNKKLTKDMHAKIERRKKDLKGIDLL